MINEKRFKENFDEISKFGALDGGGLTRLAFSNEDKNAREFLINLMKNAGLKVRIDTVGNIFAKFDNVIDPNLPAVSVGSHIDSVPKGGFYDGTLGVMAGLEAIMSIKESGIKIKRPLELIVFVCEESSRFKMATIGSKIVSGKLSLDRVKELKDDNEISVFQAMKNFGLMPENLQKSILKDNTYKSYIELHIEQGRVLEQKGFSVGIVTGIAAPIRFELNIKARADHSGATPMDMRNDALIAASHIILKAQELAKKEKTAVATVGYIRVIPGALNVVPGEVVMGVDIRDIDELTLGLVNENLRAYIKSLSKELNFSYDIKELAYDKPVKLDDDMINLLYENAKNLEINSLKMPSGAGHDAMHLKGIAKSVGMIFVPCKDGISHNINESINFEDAIKGAKILEKTMLDLASE
ncbi:N-carbamoyl-L-amino acid hydrolase [Campylobacter sputorum subsp. bubulus]|uniref:N-carbamoyl-L-amino acid hydrolase n=1 Tax=Campylobacter sputorum subsp. sputorum TaxID=32024 RepID=A0A381DJ27_9BACT|nr:M20 family metallo-hydrolase [Campylobacter sputorum]ASM35733.1 peptidase family M20/M25/M40, putative N-carbamoyl-L-amino acid amidohydrolase [Campylobacter sputorum aubsp. sputorum RM3237]KAB0580672.1 M20 family metallo-hydrolase [Campylobacter sputorum subsp. sputorum]QEL05923.1 zinc-dependent hydrolase, peptidase M20 family [Campylobacter sputorum subsp. sputorum]SUX09014.1 N-carbamoyl-L-amino acid hydrolase [Campylobacter sputorum subsp. bubulus]SUX10702.1 N-carbamoyl-L-amino acid hydr